MKYILFLLYVMLLNILIGYFTDEYLYFFPLFFFSIFASVLLMLYYRIVLKKAFVLYSFSVFLIILSVFQIADFGRTYVPVILCPVSAYLAYVFYEATGWMKKTGIIVGYLLFLTLILPVVRENIFYYENHKGVDDGDITIDFYVDESKGFHFDKDKVYVLDFWTTTCGVCIEKFPLFHNICEQYASDENVVFYAVNVANRGDQFQKTQEYIEQRNYCFQNLYVFDSNVVKDIDVYRYPTVLIVKNNKIVYNGYPALEQHILFNNLYDLVAAQLK